MFVRLYANVQYLCCPESWGISSCSPYSPAKKGTAKMTAFDPKMCNQRHFQHEAIQHKRSECLTKPIGSRAVAITRLQESLCLLLHLITRPSRGKKLRVQNRQGSQYAASIVLARTCRLGNSRIFYFEYID